MLDPHPVLYQCSCGPVQVKALAYFFSLMDVSASFILPSLFLHLSLPPGPQETLQLDFGTINSMQHRTKTDKGFFSPQGKVY